MTYLRDTEEMDEEVAWEAVAKHLRDDEDSRERAGRLVWAVDRVSKVEPGEDLGKCTMFLYFHIDFSSLGRSICAVRIPCCIEFCTSREARPLLDDEQHVVGASSSTNGKTRAGCGHAH